MFNKETTQEEDRFIKFLLSKGINSENIQATLTDVWLAFYGSKPNKKTEYVCSGSRDGIFDEPYPFKGIASTGGIFLTFIEDDGSYVIHHTLLTKEQISGFLKLKAFV